MFQEKIDTIEDAGPPTPTPGRAVARHRANLVHAAGRLDPTALARIVLRQQGVKPRLQSQLG